MPDRLYWSRSRYRIPLHLRLRRKLIHGLSRRNRYRMPSRHRRRTIRISWSDGQSFHELPQPVPLHHLPEHLLQPDLHFHLINRFPKLHSLMLLRFHGNSYHCKMPAMLLLFP